MALQENPPPSADELRAETERERPDFASSGVGGALTVIAGATILYVARDIFMPLAIAGLLTFVLAPPMLWLRHHRVPRAPSAVAVVLLAFAVILGFGSVVVGEVASLSKELPNYTTNIEIKLHGLRAAVPIDELIQRGTQLIDELREELAPTTPAALAPNASGNPAAQAPVPVEIQQQTGMLVLLETIVGPVLKPFATAGLVLVFVIFFLLNREDLRDRFIRLAGANDLHRSTQMLSDAVSRLSRYLWMQCIINTAYGTMIGLGAFIIGVPNAALWGVLSLVLRFLPYIGTWFAALFPLALSLAVAPGWAMFAEMFAVFVVVEMLASNVLEPWLFGASAGMSPVAVIVAATFWTWLWGPLGLVLATPLTACLVVIGRYVAPLRFLAVLLGNEAPLAMEERFYQRVLSGDAAEAAEQAVAFLKNGSLTGFCDEVAIPALLMAQEDSERGVLIRDKRVQINETIADLIDTIGGDEETSKDAEASPVLVECLGARSELDDAAAALLAHLLAERGIAARVIPARHWLTERRPTRIATVESGAPVITCLSYLGATSSMRMRLLTRRLRRRAGGNSRIVLGLWSTMGLLDENRGSGADMVVSALGEAADWIAEAIGPAATDTAESTVTPLSA